MNNAELNAVKQLINTQGGILNALLDLIQDLAPVIGIDEAQRLVNIIADARNITEDNV